MFLSMQLTSANSLASEDLKARKAFLLSSLTTMLYACHLLAVFIDGLNSKQMMRDVISIGGTCK